MRRLKITSACTPRSSTKRTNIHKRPATYSRRRGVFFAHLNRWVALSECEELPTLTTKASACNYAGVQSLPRSNVVGYLFPAEGVATTGATSTRALFDVLTTRKKGDRLQRDSYAQMQASEPKRGRYTLMGEVCPIASAGCPKSARG